jgi:hypothetical protein
MKKYLFGPKNKIELLLTSNFNFRKKGLQLEQPNIERRKALLQKINSRVIKKEVNQIDDVALLREDRNR